MTLIEITNLLIRASGYKWILVVGGRDLGGGFEKCFIWSEMLDRLYLLHIDHHVQAIAILFLLFVSSI